MEHVIEFIVAQWKPVFEIGLLAAVTVQAQTVKIGVILSGCGVYDGAEIHESVLTLLAIPLTRKESAPR